MRLRISDLRKHGSGGVNLKPQLDAVTQIEKVAVKWGFDNGDGTAGGESGSITVVPASRREGVRAMNLLFIGC